MLGLTDPFLVPMLLADAAVEEVVVADGGITMEGPLRQILQNAASVAGLMITTEAMVAELPKDEAPSGGGGGGGMGGMGGMDGMM